MQKAVAIEQVTTTSANKKTPVIQPGLLWPFILISACFAIILSFSVYTRKYLNQ